jgi:hypothetical protein
MTCAVLMNACPAGRWSVYVRYVCETTSERDDDLRCEADEVVAHAVAAGRPDDERDLADLVGAERAHPLEQLHPGHRRVSLGELVDLRTVVAGPRSLAIWLMLACVYVPMSTLRRRPWPGWMILTRTSEPN